MKWFKFYAYDFLSDLKMSQLSIAERLFWVTVLCLAHTEEKNGNIRYCTENLIKQKMGIQEEDPEWEELNNVFKLFEELEMIELTENGIFVKNFQKRQEMSLLPAEKMRRYREKKRSNEGYPEEVTSVTPVTPSTVTNVTSSRVDKSRVDNLNLIAPDSTESGAKPSLVQQPEQPKDKTDGNIMFDLVTWAEDRRGSPFTSRPKQLKAIKMMKVAGIEPPQIKERWREMEEDKYWEEKGFDFMNVCNSFNRRKPNE